MDFSLPADVTVEKQQLDGYRQVNFVNTQFIEQR